MKYKIAVGIPSYNEAEYIRFVLTQIDKGLEKYYSPLECLIINLDSKSKDGTKKVFLTTKTACPKKYIETLRGKGRAMLNFFKFCLKQNIPYIATIDADLTSITPDWIFKLINPIIKGYDYTIPTYTRNRFESNITNHFAYPLLYSTYPVGLRQPLGGEFGYSRRFYEYILKQPKHQKTFQYGIDIFISCNAIAGGFNIQEVYLGKKIHAPSFYHMELTFRQVFESGVFVSKIHRQYKVKPGNIILSTKSSGIDNFKYFPHKNVVNQLLKQLRRRFFRYNEAGYYSKYLNQELIKKLKHIIGGGKPNLSGDLWIDVLSNVLKKCYQSNFDIREISLISRIIVPIYRWRAASYWLEVEDMTTKESEEVVRREARGLRKKLIHC